MTFPNTISELLEIIDFTDTANSGALVPKATIVRPINILDNLQFKARLEAPSTNISAPLIKTIKPIINKIICTNIKSSFLQKKRPNNKDVINVVPP